MSERNPYVGPSGQASPDPKPMPTWTPEQMEQAEAELRDVLQRQYDMAVAMATDTPHGMPEGTPGKYAARACLLEQLLQPVHYMLPMENPGATDPNRLGRITVLPEQQSAGALWRCGVCGCLVPEAHESGGEVCRDLQAERQAKHEHD